MHLCNIPDESVDLVITSPPYGDSKTIVAYGEYSRLSLQWLNLFQLSEKNIMTIDHTLLGGKIRSNEVKSDIPSQILKTSLETIYALDAARAKEVHHFYLDLTAAIEAIAQKTAPNGYQFWVVGNRTVKNETLKTHEIIVEIAQCCGLEHLYTVDRNIINKVMPSLNSPTNQVKVTSATMTNEHIIVLRKK